MKTSNENHFPRFYLARTIQRPFLIQVAKIEILRVLTPKQTGSRGTVVCARGVCVSMTTLSVVINHANQVDGPSSQLYPS